MKQEKSESQGPHAATKGMTKRRWKSAKASAGQKTGRKKTWFEHRDPITGRWVKCDPKTKHPKYESANS